MCLCRKIELSLGQLLKSQKSQNEKHGPRETGGLEQMLNKSGERNEEEKPAENPNQVCPVAGDVLCNRGGLQLRNDGNAVVGLMALGRWERMGRSFRLELIDRPC